MTEDLKNDLKMKAFDFASATVKQLITLSTALIALSVTFREDFEKAGSESLLLACWILFFLSVLCGIWTQLSLTGTLEKSTENPENIEEQVKLSIYRSNISKPSLWQIVFFLLGLVALGTYGGQSIFAKEGYGSNEEIKIIKESTYKLVEPRKTDTLMIE